MTATSVAERNRLFVVRSPEGISLVITGYGFAIRIHGERLAVSRPTTNSALRDESLHMPWHPQQLPLFPDESRDRRRIPEPPPPAPSTGRDQPEANYEHLEFPLREVSEILLSGHGGSLTTDLISSAMERGIQLYLIRSSGEPIAAIVPPVANASVTIRRAQISAGHTMTGARLAHALLSAKIANQATTLLHFTKYSREARPHLADALRDTVSELRALVRSLPLPDPSISPHSFAGYREDLMGIEGAAASAYWSAVARLLADAVAFPGRVHRGATDPVNSALNYGYGILYSHIWGAVLRAGLDPYAGFLHTDRPGKPSLVLDLIEEFRSWVVDRTLISMFRSGFQVTFEREGNLSAETRAHIADRLLRRLDSREPHLRKSELLRNILQIQARQIAAIVRGRHPQYLPFRPKW
ncbi:MAG: CRISPR-associated endonuclease Cas1 [bacterium JZ-2024 1]